MMAARMSPAANPLAALWRAYLAYQREEAGRPEAERMAAIRDRATPPAVCGPEIPVAPARQRFRLVRELGIEPGSIDPDVRGSIEPGSIDPDVRGSGRVIDLGYRGPGEDAPRRAIAVADAFDRMARDAQRAAARAGEDYAPPFTAAQVDAGRRYAALVEAREAGLVKLASLEGRTGGSGGGGGAMDRYLENGRVLDAMRARIGDGVAMQVRRVRPSARGGAGARNISDRVLVDCVCVQEMPLEAVLKAFGWSKRGESRMALRAALRAALGRMAEGR